MIFCDSREYLRMGDPQHEIRIWLKDQLASRGRGAKGKLAAHINVRPDAITRMMNTDPSKEMREIKAHELEGMRSFFAHVDDAEEAEEEGEAVSNKIVPVMGYLGAGAEVMPEFEQVPPEGLDHIELPFALNEDLIAFRVRGESMLPFYKDGATIVVYRDQKRPLESFYGEEAAVRTEDGRRFIKTVMRGDGNTVNLMSWNAAPIEGVRLAWIGEVFATLPPAAINKAARQGGVQGQLKLRA